MMSLRLRTVGLAALLMSLAGLPPALIAVWEMRRESVAESTRVEERLIAAVAPIARDAAARISEARDAALAHRHDALRRARDLVVGVIESARAAEKDGVVTRVEAQAEARRLAEMLAWRLPVDVTVVDALRRIAVAGDTSLRILPPDQDIRALEFATDLIPPAPETVDGGFVRLWTTRIDARPRAGLVAGIPGWGWEVRVGLPSPEDDAGTRARIAIELDRLRALLSGWPLPRSGYFMVTDREGRLLIPPTSLDIALPAEAALVTDTLELELPAAGWRLILALGPGRPVPAAQRALAAAAVLFAAILVAGAIIAWIRMGPLVAPLRALRRSIESPPVDTGDTDEPRRALPDRSVLARLADRAPREIARLARSLDRMSERLAVVPMAQPAEPEAPAHPAESPAETLRETLRPGEGLARPEVTVAVSHTGPRSATGDFTALSIRGADRLFVALGTATGTELAHTTRMVAARATLLTAAETETRAQAVLDRANRVLCLETQMPPPPGTSALALILDLTSGDLSVAAAGDGGGLVIDRADASPPEPLSPAAGPPLGHRSAARFRDIARSIPPDSRIVVASAAWLDALKARKSSPSRTLSVVSQKGPEEAADALLAAATGTSGSDKPGASRPYDVTVMVIDYRRRTAG